MIPYYEMYAKKVGDTGIFVALDSRETVQNGAKDIGYWFGKLFSKNDTKETPKVVAKADESLPFPDESFDKILMSNLPAIAIDESWRVLKEGGTLIFCFNELFSVPVLTLLFRKLMREKNFTDIKLVPISPGSIPLIFTNWAVTGKKPTK